MTASLHLSARAARAPGAQFFFPEVPVVLLRLGGRSLATFGLLAGLGGALGSWTAIARQHQAGLGPERFAVALYLAVPLLAIVGSRLFSALLEGEPVLRAPWRLFHKHGYCFQGGLLLAIAGICATAVALRLDLLILLDTFALSMPLAHAFGRMGCHSYGCCHGKPTRFPFAMRYSDPESKAVWRSGLGGVPLHATQLYSALGNLALFGILALLAERPLAPGQISAVFLVLGSSGRFVIEMLRGVPSRRFGELTPFQIVALVLQATGILLVGALAGVEPRPLFAMPLPEAISLSGGQAWAPGLVLVLAIVAFGLHGRRVGAGAGSAPTSSLPEPTQGDGSAPPERRKKQQ